VTLEELEVLSVGLRWRLVNSGIESDSEIRGQGGSQRLEDDLMNEISLLSVLRCPECAATLVESLRPHVVFRYVDPAGARTDERGYR
jgi:hypothetical protein